jgi:cell envelope-related function transcriptional attenuator common domain
MKCSSARELIAQRDSDLSALQAEDLDKHIAHCPDCAAYHKRAASALQNDTELLTQLLQQIPLSKPNDTVKVNSRMPARRSRKRSQSLLTSAVRWLGYSSLLLLFVIICVLLSLFVVVRRNVQALIVSTPTVSLPIALSDGPMASAITPQPLRPSATLARSDLALDSPLLPTLLPTTKIAYPSTTQAINVLLLGSDERPDETEKGRTDTVVIVHIDPKNERVALLSLPRDLIVSIPGYGQGRINSAYSYGGVPLVRSTVSNLLGIPIHYYASVNFDGFMAVVDAVDGIDVMVENELYDPQFPTMDYGYTVAHFLPGLQHMDGERALMYSRIRHPDSDYNRIKRQQTVILALIDRLKEQNILQNLQSMMSISQSLKGYVQTDMPEELIFSLAWTFRSFAPSDVELYSLDANDVSEGVIPDDPYASFALPGRINQRVRELLGNE